MRHPPEFWQHDGLPARLLAPLGALYDLAGMLRRRFATPRRVEVPVICVGNATLGGSGKTPITMDLAARLARHGRTPAILSRGYGGRSHSQPVRVDPRKHDAVEVGDEALLLARAAETWVCPDRAAGAAAAIGHGADVLVMDDGLQNPGLAKDLSLLVVDAGAGIGNSRVFPAGPLRERWERALGRADAVVLMGDDATGLAAGIDPAVPVFHAELRPDAAALGERRVLAFAGIGRPERFVHTLTDLGAQVVETRTFPDHHPYTPAELHRLWQRAESLDATPATTEKDAVRLPVWARQSAVIVPVRVAWDDAATIEHLLDSLFADARL